ncbi:MAG: peptidase M14 [Gammaproteobacteria bacterium]|nr:MAG: peptidase M14 [Gammaproteobacteria bacterium]
MLTELSDLPDGLLDCDAKGLSDRLSGSTLIHLKGKQPEPLFVCVLQHGNEDAGWLAVRELLRDYQEKELPRALSLFISNVEAAQYGVRRLEHQIDYNRIWPGCDSTGTDEHRLMREVWENMRERQVFASIDIHNNTGRNPHYACVNKLDNRFFNLARTFSRTVVYFIRPTGVQSMAFAQLCPSVTVECGKPGQEFGVSHARDFVEEVMALDHISDKPVHASDMSLYHTVATVKVPEHLSIGFGEDDRDIGFIENLDQLNFLEHPARTVLGRINKPRQSYLEAWDETGQEVASEYFEYKDNKIRTRKPVMPSMLTRDCKIIKQDCLCYLMERMDIKD